MVIDLDEGNAMENNQMKDTNITPEDIVGFMEVQAGLEEIKADIDDETLVALRNGGAHLGELFANAMEEYERNRDLFYDEHHKGELEKQDEDAAGGDDAGGEDAGEA